MDRTIVDYADKHRSEPAKPGILKRSSGFLAVAFAGATLGGVFSAALDRAELVTDVHAIEASEMATRFEPLSMNDPGHPMVDIYQKRLVRAGYLKQGTADGVFGPVTAAATLRLQKDLGIDQTGVADSITQAKLHNMIIEHKNSPKPPALR